MARMYFSPERATQRAMLQLLPPSQSPSRTLRLPASRRLTHSTKASGTTATDASGHGITGTLTNGPTFTAGKYGNAVNLDGINDYVDLGNPTALQLTGSMTLSAWVYVSSFPADDAVVISKRGATRSDSSSTSRRISGTRTIGFKLTSSSGGQMFRYGTTALQTNTWYHIAGVYNATTKTMDVYLNGVLDNGALVGTVTASQQNSTANVNIGRRPGTSGFEFAGRIDDVRIANQRGDAVADPGRHGNTTSPALGHDCAASPDNLAIAGAQVSSIVTVTADATDNAGVAGVQFFVDGVATRREDTTAGLCAHLGHAHRQQRRAHADGARARYQRQHDALRAGDGQRRQHQPLSRTRSLRPASISRPPSSSCPTGACWWWSSRERSRCAAALYAGRPDACSCSSPMSASAGVQQGIYDIALDPNFATNHYYYIFYTAGTPNHDRLSRFTANATLTGTVARKRVHPLRGSAKCQRRASRRRHQFRQ